MTADRGSSVGNDEGVAVVIIVAYTHPEEVAGCIATLAKSALSEFEIIVVENGGAAAFSRLNEALSSMCSSSPSPSLAVPPIAELRSRDISFRTQRHYLESGQPLLVIDANENLGYAAAINVGLRCILPVDGWCGAWILNPDTEPAPNALKAVVAYARNGKYGLVGSRIVIKASNLIQMHGGAVYCPAIGRARSIGRGQPADAPADVSLIERQLDWLSGAAMYATADFVRTVGMMEEKYFLYCEDIDWSLRRGKFRLGYAHDSIVIHASGTTIGSSGIKSVRSNLSAYLAERNTHLLERAFFPHLYLFMAIATLLLLPDNLVRGNWRVFRAACRGWLAGVRGETGQPLKPI